MKFTFTERKIDLSKELRDYAEKKLSKLDKYFPVGAAAHVTFGLERGRHWLEVTVKNDNMYFRANERDGDLYHAIDNAVSTIDRQIRKNKTRLEKRLRDGAFVRDINTIETRNEDFVEEEKEFKIIRTKKFSVKPMADEEAILQMNLLGHEFFVYKNIKNDNFSVVYKRKDGGYGLIEND